MAADCIFNVLLDVLLREVLELKSRKPSEGRNAGGYRPTGNKNFDTTMTTTCETLNEGYPILIIAVEFIGAIDENTNVPSYRDAVGYVFEGETDLCGCRKCNFADCVNPFGPI